MSFSDKLAIFALVVSTVSFIISYWHSRATFIAEIRPIVVIVYEMGWIVRNIGRGPAMNIVVATKDLNGKWADPRRLPPLASEAGLRLPSLGHTFPFSGVGVSYTDFKNRPYTSLYEKDHLTQILDGNSFPAWKEDEIQAGEFSDA